MISARKFQKTILFLGDVILLYLSLFLTFVFRYYPDKVDEAWLIHKMPFAYIHITWLAIFFIAGLYDIHIFGSFKKLLERTIKAMIPAALIAILIFYLIPTFIITPKTNLSIDVALLALLMICWRRIFWDFIAKLSRTKTLFFGSSDEVEKMTERLKSNPYLGYEPKVVLQSIDHNLINLIKENEIELIIASKNILKDKNAAEQFYKVLPLGVSVASFEDFYESIVEKIPLSLINEEWFLENLKEINKKTYEKIKRSFDIIGAIFLMIPTFIFLPFIALAIKTESRGPIFYKEKRVGRNGKIFNIIKFRTMINNAEKDTKWISKKDPNDPRITNIGRVLRKVGIDELPQVFNIIKGQMSIIGPRPEKPEFVKNLEREIPYYAMRQLVNPGVTGWAQIKFSRNASVDDSMEKLQYDLYYIKNRSLILDLAIAAKTLGVILSGSGR